MLYRSVPRTQRVRTELGQLELLEPVAQGPGDEVSVQKGATKVWMRVLRESTAEGGYVQGKTVSYQRTAAPAVRKMELVLALKDSQ